jgi:hypothetical protein
VHQVVELSKGHGVAGLLDLCLEKGDGLCVGVF